MVDALVKMFCWEELGGIEVYTQPARRTEILS